MSSLQSAWYDGSRWPWLLVPLTGLFCLLSTARRWAYRLGLRRAWKPPVPVIVVGNISVGGTGKTPMVVWLARHARQLGHRPGVLTRGYRGKATDWPQAVSADSDPAMVGDEALLLARRAGCPVVAGPIRRDDARRLLAAGCDLIISDDGLQHYALGRDIEIVVVDGERGVGNGLCLPAGPLREPVGRLGEADLLIGNGATLPGLGVEHAMGLIPGGATALKNPQAQRDLASFRGQPVRAIAGIGHPERFFSMLRQAGLEVEAKAFPDHHEFSAGDLVHEAGSALLMTEKDAVKCEAMADDSTWYVPVEAEPDAAFVAQLDTLLKGLRDG